MRDDFCERVYHLVKKAKEAKTPASDEDIKKRVDTAIKKMGTTVGAALNVNVPPKWQEEMLKHIFNKFGVK